MNNPTHEQRIEEKAKELREDFWNDQSGKTIDEYLIEAISFGIQLERERVKGKIDKMLKETSSYDNSLLLATISDEINEGNF